MVWWIGKKVAILHSQTAREGLGREEKRSGIDNKE
jgi:hypothetical protein